MHIFHRWTSWKPVPDSYLNDLDEHYNMKVKFRKCEQCPKTQVTRA